MNSKELRIHVQFMTVLAQQAGAVIMKYLRQGERLTKEWTSKTHFSTAADRAVGELLRNAVAETYPEYNIMSEELPEHATGSRYTWVFDELDGTIPFRTGMDTFTTCLALCDGTMPIAGVVYAPRRKELYVACNGSCATMNGRLISVSSETNINHVLMAIDSGKATEKDPKARCRKIPYLDKLLRHDGIACDLNLGCASVPLCFTARGLHQAYLATSLNPEDMAAAVVIIRQAGGRVTNLKGEEWQLGDPSILAANPILHQILFDRLAEKIPSRKGGDLEEEHGRRLAESVFGH